VNLSPGGDTARFELPAAAGREDAKRWTSAIARHHAEGHERFAIRGPLGHAIGVAFFAILGDLDFLVVFIRADEEVIFFDERGPLAIAGALVAAIAAATETATTRAAAHPAGAALLSEENFLRRGRRSGGKKTKFQFSIEIR
jgi:hypothetical protein